MDGDVVHDKESSLFFVTLTNDGGKSLLSTQLFCSTSITGFDNFSKVISGKTTVGTEGNITLCWPRCLTFVFTLITFEKFSNPPPAN